MVVARGGGGECRPGPQGADVKCGGYAWIAGVDGVVSRYFCCLRREEVKMNSVGRVTPSLDFVAYRRICVFVYSFVSLILNIVFSFVVMDKFTMLARFGNISLGEVTRVQGDFVQMFSRYPDASIT